MMDKTVLVVDDDDMTRSVVAGILRGSGYQVVMAQNGEEGLGALATMAPEAILLDVRMPGIDGVEVCRRIRQNPDRADTPVIFVTAYAEQKLIDEVRAIPGTHIISKPFLPFTFLEKFRRCLAA